MRQMLNSALDALPRPRLGYAGHVTPTFLACGITGYYVALIVLFAGGLLAGRSLVVLAALAVVCALSFFAYTYLRMWITGHEKLVLLEHVWFALACCALVLRLMGEPVLSYLDVVSVALCPFLAFGRIGCTLVGCCHGKPASVGIVYREAFAQEGFPSHLVGVRLFPVPAIEAAGLLCIGATGLIALPVAQAGRVFVWYLLAYSVMRFGLEGLRGDRRPHLLGLSQARWMSIVEVGLALRLGAGVHSAPATPAYAALGLALILALALLWKRDVSRTLLAPAHRQELRELVMSQMLRETGDRPTRLMSPATSKQVAVAVSFAGAAARVSMSLPDGRRDLSLLCDLSAAAFPEVRNKSARYSAGGVLHFSIPVPLTHYPPEGQQCRRLAQVLYGNVVRRFQADTESTPSSSDAGTAEPQGPPTVVPQMTSENGAGASKQPSPSYFAGGSKDRAS